jgi:DNA invertase Pin-like site-specific DNA recombinase
MKPAKQIAAAYARYSTDEQNDKSIDDQNTLCQQIAKRHGDWTFKKEFLFDDRAKSSASMYDRPGVLALMMAAKSKGFNAVFCESLDRLSRDEEDLPGIFKRLQFHGIDIITLGGVTTQQDIQIRCLTGPIALKDVRDKVRRHHDARAREGLIPGGIAYGYRKKPGGQNGEREIDLAEAAVVIRIFREYVSGKSCRDIALGLTRDGIPSPSGAKHWDQGTFTHGRGDSRGMIGNRLYIGIAVWDDYTTIKSPYTGKKVRRKNKPEDVIITDVPHLRIIDQDLWDRAQSLNRGRAEKIFGKGGKRTKVSRRTTVENLIAGLLICGQCGGHMRISKSNSKRTDAPGVLASRVSCAAATSTGTCEHRKSYDLDILERTVLVGVKKHLTSPAALMEYTKAYHERWAERQKAAHIDIPQTQKALNRATVACDNAATAITELGAIPALMQRMKALEVERASLENALEHAKAETNVIALHPAVIKKFAADIKEIHESLTGKGTTPETMMLFRAAFRNIFDRITVHPTAARKPYEITPLARLTAIMGSELFPTMRTADEMLAEQGGSAVPIRGAKGERDPRASNRCRPS